MSEQNVQTQDETTDDNNMPKVVESLLDEGVNSSGFDDPNNIGNQDNSIIDNDANFSAEPEVDELKKQLADMAKKYDKLIDIQLTRDNNQAKPKAQPVQLEPEVMSESPGTMSRTDFKNLLDTRRRNTVKAIYDEVGKALNPIYAEINKLSATVTSLSSIASSGVNSDEILELQKIIKDNGLGSVQDPYKIAKMIKGNKQSANKGFRPKNINKKKNKEYGGGESRQGRGGGFKEEKKANNSKDLRSFAGNLAKDLKIPQ